MSSSEELASFIASSFRSVWALEVLLLLKQGGRPFSTEDLVEQMRASSFVIEKALDSLVSAGLADTDGNSAVYRPVSPGVASLVDGAEQLYRSRPSHVRRLIVAASHTDLTAFSNAFRLKD